MGNLPNIKGATEFGASRVVKIQVNYNSCMLWFEKRNAGKNSSEGADFQEVWDSFSRIAYTDVQIYRTIKSVGK